LTSPGAAANGGGGTVTSRSGEQYFFNKNGAIIPYSAFVSLLDSESFQEYLRQVKCLHEGKPYKPSCLERKKDKEDENDDDDDDDDDDDVEEVKDDEDESLALANSKKRRAAAVKKMRYGKARRTIAFLTDDEDEAELRIHEPTDLGVTPLASENEEEEDRNSGQQAQSAKENNCSHKEEIEKKEGSKEDVEIGGKKEERKGRKK
jgi:hypothetical protein